MASTRRNFLQLAAAVAAAAGSHSFAGASPVAQSGLAPRSLKLLILGGTGFIGPKIVSHALERGHEVTIFNRGRTNTHLFPDIERLIGDRDGQLDSLNGREWDAVIDDTGYVPRHVRYSTDLLKGFVGRYLFTSTGSVYEPAQEVLSEDSRLQTIEDPDSEDVSQYYGQLKVQCEQVVQQRFGDAATIVRPHIVGGPGDKSDRYTYWPVRIDRGGEVVAPGNRSNPVQYIDVRDLAEFCVRLVEDDTSGIYNAAGPTYSDLPMEEFLCAIRGITSSEVKFTWIDETFLAKHDIGVQGYPLWISTNSDMRGFTRMRNTRGVEKGLSLRPLAVTAYDTLEWFKRQPEDQRKTLELKLSLDSKILNSWHSR